MELLATGYPYLALLNYLLMDELSITNDEAASLLATGKAISTIPAILNVLVIGVVYDTYGRRKVLFVILLLIGTLKALLPLARSRGIFLVQFSLL